MNTVNNTLIVPAILETDIREVENKLHVCESMGEWVHIDILDGKFVENTSVSLDDIATLETDLKREVHLMVKNPLVYLRAANDYGFDRAIIHIEAVEDLGELEVLLNEIEIEVAIAINPETPIAAIAGLIPSLTSVLCMTINPGKQGQPFMPEVMDKVKALYTEFPSLEIEVDGGINEHTILGAKSVGATRFVVGSGISKASNPRAMYEKLITMIQ